VFAALCVAAALSAVTPAVPPLPVVPVVRAGLTVLPELERNAPPARADAPRERPLLLAADEALAAGLSRLAAGLYERAAAAFPADAPERRAALLGLATARLEHGDADGARAALATVAPSPERRLRAALADLLGNRFAAAGIELRGIEASALPRADAPWLHIARGLAALETGAGGAQSGEFARAAALFTADGRPRLARHAEFLGSYAAVRVGPVPDDAELTRLRSAAALETGSPSGFQYVKMLAIGLARRSLDAEAAAVLRRAGAGDAERAEANLLAGLILGAEKQSGRDALYALLAAPAAPEAHRRAALEVLAAAGGATAEGRAVAEEIHARLTRLAPTFDPAASDALNLARARVMAAAGDAPAFIERAERAAGELLERTPASPLAPDALRVLAACAWRARAFARAAGYFGQLRRRSPPEKSPRLALAAADCLFLAARGTVPDSAGATEAWTAAADAYADAAPRQDTPEARGAALFSRVTCEIAAGRGEAAMRALDGATGSFCDEAGRLRCEWAIVEWLRSPATRRTREAAARLDTLFARAPRMSAGFDIRFRWQRALVALALGDTAGAAERAARLAEFASRLPADAPEEVRSRADAIVSRALLLRARAALMSDRAAAVPILAELRRKFPNEEAAAASYVAEGRTLAAAGDAVGARRVFLEGSERYGKAQSTALAEHAAEALYEAALQDIALGKNGTAIESLSRFAEARPDHPLAAEARLTLADLFRNSDNFDDALAIYERLAATLRDSPARMRAEMGRADCLFARATRTRADAALGLATDAYERLFALPGGTADFKAEAGCKWAAALELRQTGRLAGGRPVADIVREAREARWQVVNQTLRAPGAAARLGATGRYWVARTLLELSDSYKTRGEPAEAAKVCRLALEYNASAQGRAGFALPHQAKFQRELALLTGATTPVPQPPVVPPVVPAVTAPAAPSEATRLPSEPPPEPPPVATPPTQPQPTQPTPTTPAAAIPPTTPESSATSTPPMPAPSVTLPVPVPKP
jgi:TolA-binding protein